jgi:hypothetical protein
MADGRKRQPDAEVAGRRAGHLARRHNGSAANAPANIAKVEGSGTEARVWISPVHRAIGVPRLFDAIGLSAKRDLVFGLLSRICG